jgi:hypothetical protein
MRHFVFLAALCVAPFLTQAAFAQSTGPAYECNLSGVPGGANLAGCPDFPDNTGVHGSNTTTAQGVVTGNTTSPPTCSTASADVPPYCGARSDGIAVAPINTWRVCRWVDNSSSAEAIFVPFKTSNEWLAFRTAASPPHSLSGIALTDCAEPVPTGTAGAAVIQPTYPNDTNTNCTTVTLSAPNVPNVYGRTGLSKWPDPVPAAPSPFTPTFNCHGGATTITSQIQWIAGDADHLDSSGWSWSPNYKFSPDLIFTAKDLSNPSNPGNNSASITVNSDVAVQLSFKTDPSATVCTAGGGWNGSWSGSQLPAASGDVSPIASTTYTVACTGTNGLTSTASLTVYVNGKCGTDSGQTLASAPVNLCGAGDTASNFTSTGGGWSWDCTPPAALGGGNQEPCGATLESAMCGTATVDTSGNLVGGTLCNTGTPSAVSGINGSYTCTTESGGASNTQSCTATIQQPPSCVPTCSVGGANVGGNCWYLSAYNQSCDAVCSGYGGYNSATLSYAGSGGTDANCKAVLNAITPAYSFSDSIYAYTLGCAVDSWHAAFRYITPTSSSSQVVAIQRACACGPSICAPPPVNGVCGSDNGATLASTPTNLCSAGTASDVSGSGPWSWTCAGSNGGSSASCSAAATPTCSGGFSLGGYCWYIGSLYQPCSTICAAHGGTLEAINISDAQCSTIFNTFAGSTMCVNNPHCSFSQQDGYCRWMLIEPSGGSSGSACACNTAQITVNGVCGSANGMTQNMDAIQGIIHGSECSSGDPGTVKIDYSTGNSAYWTCNGEYGGSSANCSAPFVP